MWKKKRDVVSLFGRAVVGVVPPRNLSPTSCPPPLTLRPPRRACTMARLLKVREGGGQGAPRREEGWVDGDGGGRVSPAPASRPRTPSESEEHTSTIERERERE